MPGPNCTSGGLIEYDLDRYALHDLDVIAGRILRRQQAERGAAAGLNAVDVAGEFAVGIGVDSISTGCPGRIRSSSVSLKLAVTQTSRGTNIINAWPTAA